MGAARPCGMFLALLLACAMSAPSARADEMLVMPYSCKVVGGRPMLTPSEDQGHPVIGRRQQQEFRACSPADPKLCRRWDVHRFDLDCGGVRVPWVDVAAAAGAGSGDGEAFVADGHFELEMPARWSLPADAPCARGGDMEGPGFRRFCAERLANLPRVTVTMPRGFAPMAGIDGIFVNQEAPRDAVAVATPTHRDDPIPQPIANPQRGKSAPHATDAETRNAPAAPLPARTAEAERPKSPPPAGPAPTKTDPPPIGSAAAGAPVIPQIINGANPPPAAGDQASRSGVSETSALPDPVQAHSPPASSATRAQSEVAGSGAAVPDQVASADREETPSSVLPVAVPDDLRDLTPTVITMGTVGVLSLLTLGFLVLRRGRVTPAPVLSRDISAVSFDVHKRQDTESALAIVPEPLTGRDVDTPPSLSAGPPAPFGDAMPRTRAEALDVLGMGVTPDVSEAAIKKIIDGLRLSWHPDHATDAAERAQRELRLKQINAAWDIISGKRAS